MPLGGIYFTVLTSPDVLAYWLRWVVSVSSIGCLP
jgi:hypothetical protein